MPYNLPPNLTKSSIENSPRSNSLDPPLFLWFGFCIMATVECMMYGLYRSPGLWSNMCSVCIEYSLPPSLWLNLCIMAIVLYTIEYSPPPPHRLWHGLCIMAIVLYTIEYSPCNALLTSFKVCPSYDAWILTPNIFPTGPFIDFSQI